MLALAAYTNWVFPAIPFKLGGGEIVSTTIYLTPGHQVRIIHAGMLDESDQGFFILVPGQERGLFIPKEQVEGIYFSSGPSDPGKMIQ